MAAVVAAEDRSRLHVIQGPMGMGKTRVGVGLVDHFLAQGYQVLWIAHSWLLLQQAAQELLSLFPRYGRTLRRVGGDNECLKHLPQDSRGRVFLTTLQTWGRRKKCGTLPLRLQRDRNLLIIWDECHFAVNAPLGKRLQRFYLDRRGGRQNPAVIGLSATPKSSDAGLVNLIWGKPYSDMIGDRVAYPILKNVKTNVVWDPIVRNQIVSPHSLQELAANAGRNELIVRELLAGRQEGRYRRIVVFACSIKHANILSRMIAEGGAPARVLHSGLSKKRRKSTFQKFRKGEIDVLVNVNQLREGANVPEINAVFIARPTTSKIPLLQMLGRGSRPTEAKKHFWVVEFTDIIRRSADEFFHASCLIDDMGQHVPPGRSRYRGPVRHAEPDEVSLETLALPEIGAVTFARDQTFGVEIELTSPDGIPAGNSRLWHEGARTIISRVLERANAPVCPQPLGYHQNDDPAQWVVERDSSAGWEIVSPILANAEGFEELQRVCQGLADLVRSDGRFHINHRTGLHLTLATRLNTDERLRGFVKRVQRLEPGLMTLVAPSRLFGFGGGRYDCGARNSYCVPMREAIPHIDELSLATFALNDDRYYSVNLAHAFDGIEKLEIRLHSGTTDFRKIAPWISLWMLIFNKSRYTWIGDRACGPVFDGGDCSISAVQAAEEDIFTLLQREGIFLGVDLARALHRRRSALQPAWAKVLPRRVTSWRSAGWYDAPPVAASPLSRFALVADH